MTRRSSHEGFPVVRLLKDIVEVEGVPGTAAQPQRKIDQAQQIVTFAGNGRNSETVSGHSTSLAKDK